MRKNVRGIDSLWEGGREGTKRCIQEREREGARGWRETG